MCQMKDTGHIQIVLQDATGLAKCLYPFKGRQYTFREEGIKKG